MRIFFQMAGRQVTMSRYQMLYLTIKRISRPSSSQRSLNEAADVSIQPNISGIVPKGSVLAKLALGATKTSTVSEGMFCAFDFQHSLIPQICQQFLKGMKNWGRNLSAHHGAAFPDGGDGFGVGDVLIFGHDAKTRCKPRRGLNFSQKSILLLKV
jgi:hypothetical protein